jgi:hypothetical protein
MKTQDYRPLTTDEWRRGRSRGGFNTWEPEKAKAVRSAGGRAAMAKRWGGS